MLSYEAQGTEDLLRNFGLGELCILADSVTRKHISVNSKKEAIHVITTYSRSAEDVLMRREITKKSLVHYLVSNDIEFSIRRNKSVLVSKILEFWREKYQTTSPGDDEGEILIISSTSIEDGIVSWSTAQGMDSIYTGSKSCEGTSTVSKSCEGSCTVSRLCKPIQVVDSTPTQYSIVNNYSTNHNNIIISHGDEKSTAVCGQEEPKVDQISPHLQKFGETFTKWFFERWNAKNPFVNSTSDSVYDFGPHSFWDNASLMSLCIFPERACVEDQATGAKTVSEKLAFLVKEQQLFFNPNISHEAVKVKSDVNGHMIIFVCGTVHRHHDCIGNFDQTFGLLKVPSMMYDEWKIKTVHLKIEVSDPFPKNVRDPTEILSMKEV